MASSLSHLPLVRLLLAIAAMVITMNMMYMFPRLPEISIHVNPYVFSDEGHMQKPMRQFAEDADADRDGGKSQTEDGEAGGDGEKSVSDWMKENADLNLTPEMVAQLPTWSQVREVVGSAPVILGLDSCPRYREIVPALERMLGPAGIFNTGTNLVTHLLKKNCEIPERREASGPNQSKESYGMRWQVPWGKHTPAKFRKLHSTKLAAAIKKEYVLPVVAIRHPYSWFGSMCKNGYTAKWSHTKTKREGDGKPLNCPNLKQGNAPNAPWNPVTVTYAEKREDHHFSLAHLWNEWYSYYLDLEARGGGDDFPYLVIRLEDLIFYPQETTRQVCECAGGKIRDDQTFQLITDSAKGDSQGHDHSTGIFEAWIKYSKPNTKERHGFSEVDYTNAINALNGTLMEAMGYKHPS